MKIIHVVGARPNFMKAAPLLRALRRDAAVRQLLVHTGQHYDENMSDSFFRQLEMPSPDLNLGVGSGSHAQQVAEIMVRLEPFLLAERPDLVVVYGDVNSTMAATLVAAKLPIRVSHVEAGLRSGDRTMPEEVNRVVTDRLADDLLAPSQDAVDNLLREGAPPDAIHLVGNIMIDTLVALLPSTNPAAALAQVGLAPGREHVLVTLHRPSNVDDVQRLAAYVGVLRDLARRVPVIFPVHPRTRARLAHAGIDGGDVRLCEPMGYVEFLALQRGARLVITDSGGIQEETTYLGIPCLTVRDSTERPITTSLGTNRLIGTDPEVLRHEADRVLAGDAKHGQVPPLWDGHTAERICAILRSRVASA